jgi:hypothetical protein
MKEEEPAIPQFREWMFVDLTMEDDGIEESEEELRFVSDQDEDCDLDCGESNEESNEKCAHHS